MRTSYLIRFAGILFALTVITGAVTSRNIYQGGRCANGAGTFCFNNLTGITQDQKSQITALYAGHQKAMNDLREKCCSTSDFTEKKQIREQMEVQIENHRKAVRAILNTSQQQQFDQTRRGGCNPQFRNRSNRQWCGCGMGNGQGFGCNRQQ